MKIYRVVMAHHWGGAGLIDWDDGPVKYYSTKTLAKKYAKAANEREARRYLKVQGEEGFAFKYKVRPVTVNVA